MSLHVKKFINPAFPCKLPQVPRTSQPLPEPIFTGSSGGFAWLFKDENQIQRPPVARTYKNEGTIAKITSNKMDLLMLYEMDPTYLECIKVLIDVDAFLSHLNGPLPHIRKSSRFMLQHLGTLLEYDTVSIATQPLSYTLPLFTTPKKIPEQLRLIQDCRPLNSVYDRAPEMDLPLIHVLIAYILSHKFMAQTDGVSFFYQFVLDTLISLHFGARMTNARGKYVDVVMNRMPMGWSWAPTIGQRSANVLIRNIGIAWVDNFILVAHDEKDFSQRKIEFFRRIKKVNLEVDKTPEEMVPVQEDIALGIQFNLRLGLYRIDPQWVEKATIRIKDLLSTAKVTRKNVYVLSGTICWHHYTVRRDLCHLAHLLQFVGRTARAVHAGGHWEEQVDMPVEVRSEILEALELIRLNEWKKPKTALEPECEIWSDASDTHWAFLVFAKDILVGAKSGLTKEELHIFYSELSCALGGISGAARLGFKSARSNIDNAAAGGALQKGASTNFVANRWLSRRMLKDLEVKWVSTRDMLADPFTRPYPFTNKVPPLPPLGTKISEVRAFLGRTNALRERESHTAPKDWGKQATKERHTHSQKVPSCL